MLDRPISEFDGPVDSVRVPVVPPTGAVQAVPGGTDRARGPAEASRRSYTPTARASSAITRTSSSTTRPSRVRASASWPAGAARTATVPEGRSRTRGSGRSTPRTIASIHYQLPPSYQYMRNWNKGYMEWAQRVRMRRFDEPILIQLYSEVLQTFRLAAQGKRPGRQPPAHLRERIERYADPLPFWYPPLETRGHRPRALSARRDHAAADGDVPLVGLAERVAAPDPQPQLSCSSIRAPRRRAGIADGGWMWVESPWGRVRCMARYSEAVEPVDRVDVERDRQGARRVAALRPMRTKRTRGFLLNHLITEELPGDGGDAASPTPIRSPARPAGTTCACASRRPGPMNPRRTSRRRSIRCPRYRAPRPCFPSGSPTLPATDYRDDPARPRHRPQRLRGLPRLRDELQGVEHVGSRRRHGRRASRTDATRPAPSSTACRRSRSASIPTRRPCISRSPACIARTRRACPCARPARSTSAPRTASCWSTTTSASAASTARGRARTACASSTSSRR